MRETMLMAFLSLSGCATYHEQWRKHGPCAAACTKIMGKMAVALQAEETCTCWVSGKEDQTATVRLQKYDRTQEEQEYQAAMRAQVARLKLEAERDVAAAKARAEERRTVFGPWPEDDR